MSTSGSVNGTADRKFVEIAADASAVRKIAWSAFAGTALEWYDFFLFGTAAAIVFDRLYFAGLGPTAASLGAFASFGVGLLATPLGALLFGWLGDKIGRKPALIGSIAIIGISTGLIGLLPDADSIGFIAPVLLTLLRLLQGIAVGGEWSGATTMAVEHSPLEKRAGYSALVQLGSPAGTLLSSGAMSLVLLLPEESFDSWGWRIPFLAAFPFLGIVLWLRSQMEESPVFKTMLEAESKHVEMPFITLVRDAWKPLIVAVCGALIGIGGFFILLTYAMGYVTNELGVARQDVVVASIVAALCEIVIIVFFGHLAGRFGAGKIMLIGGFASLVLAWPVWLAINTGNTLLIILGISVGISVISIPYAVTGTLLSELFPAAYRYTGVAVGYNVANAIGGLMPLIAASLTAALAPGSYAPAVWLLVLMSLLTMWAGWAGEKMRIVDQIHVVEKVN